MLSVEERNNNIKKIEDMVNTFNDNEIHWLLTHLITFYSGDEKFVDVVIEKINEIKGCNI